MPDYRVFLIGKDGGVVAAHPLVCDDDTQAKAAALELWPSSVRELWNLSRRVAVIDPNATPSSAEPVR